MHVNHELKDMAHLRRRSSSGDMMDTSVRFSVLDLLFSRVALIGVIVALACQLYMHNLYAQFPDGLPEGDRGRLVRHHLGIQLLNVKALLRTYLYDVSFVEAYREETERNAVHEMAAIRLSSTNFTIEETRFDGVRVLVLRPRDGVIRKRKGIIYIHGGGMIFTSPEYNIHIGIELVERTGSLVIMPSYRLAPEHPWPAGMNDCVTAITYVMKHAEELGIDAERVVLTGASAGGNLASAAVLKMTRNVAVSTSNCKDAEVEEDSAHETVSISREHHRKSACQKHAQALPAVIPRKQILVYPGLQGSSFRTTSYLRAVNDPFTSPWTNAFVIFLYAGGYRRLDTGLTHQISCYSKQGGVAHSASMQPYLDMFSDRLGMDSAKCALPAPVVDAQSNPYISILSTPEPLTALPYTVIYTAEADGLRDDGMMFYARLKDEGVRATFKNFLCVHGALQMFKWLTCGRWMMEQFIVEVNKDDYY